MEQLDVKVTAIVEEVAALRKVRMDLEDKISRQFTEQIK